MLVIPLRAPQPLDLKRCLSDWLDSASSTGECGFSSIEVEPDLERLAVMRNKLCAAGSDPSEAIHVLSTYYDYHAALLECEARGFPARDAPHTKVILPLSWLSSTSSSSSSNHDSETFSNLTWERANVLWNVAALQSYQAVQQAQLQSKSGWKQSAQLYQAAASTMHHLKELQLSYGQDFQQYASFWESTYLAEAQVSTYYLARSSPKPQHYLLAKLAIAAVPVYNEAVECISNTNNGNSEWKQYCKAWSVFIAAAAEYHEACHHKSKSQHGMELARLERAREYIVICQDFVYSLRENHPSLQYLKDQLPPMVQWIRDCKFDAEQKNQYLQQEVPDEVREIVGELVPKSNHPLTPECKTPQNMFGSVLGVRARRAMESFTRELDGLVFEMTSACDEHTEAGRKALAEVNLPHSLTTYEQEQSGGGIPTELWKRIDEVQKQRKIPLLKGDLWHLKDAADEAQTAFRKISEQLKEDVELDRLFREQNPGFEGHNVLEVQRTFTLSLENYRGLLGKSRDGDQVLIARCDRLDTEQNFKLLQFAKSQLDRLLPAQDASRGGIDTSLLRRLLVDLSALYSERKDMLLALKEAAGIYDIRPAIVELDPNDPDVDTKYENIVRSALRSFDGFVYDLRFNLDKQAGLVDSILEENDRFVSAQEAIMGSSLALSSDNCISRIEDALDELEQLRKHVKEGRGFYNSIMPKLNELQQQVTEVSTRLAVERLEYQDRTSSTEEEDARMAASLARESPGVGPGAHQSGASRESRNGSYSSQNGRTPASSVSPVPSRPGATSVSHERPHVTVDDEKVASLVAMEFDPDRVVAALDKYDNNVEQALNELLMG
jgi:hypothetical protein